MSSSAAILTFLTPVTSFLPDLKMNSVKIADLVRPYPMPFTYRLYIACFAFEISWWGLSVPRHSVRCWPRPPSVHKLRFFLYLQTQSIQDFHDNTGLPDHSTAEYFERSFPSFCYDIDDMDLRRKHLTFATWFIANNSWFWYLFMLFYS